MPHIHTKPGQHDSTASAFIVRLDTPEPSLLLHMHKKLGKLMQFGGHVELLENPWEAVCHEISEESGYDISQLQLLQPFERLRSLTHTRLHPSPIYVATFPFPGLNHFHDDIGYAFVTNQSPRHAVASGESVEIRLFNAAELRSLPDDLVSANIRETGLFVLDTCLSNWERLNAADMA